MQSWLAWSYVDQAGLKVVILLTLPGNKGVHLHAWLAFYTSYLGGFLQQTADLQGKKLYNSACLLHTWEIPRERWGKFPPFSFTWFVSRVLFWFIYVPVYILVIFFKGLVHFIFFCIKTPQLVATAGAWDFWIETLVWIFTRWSVNSW